MDREELARMLEEGLSLETIGVRAGKHPSTIGYWIKKHGLSAANAERHRARGGIERETLEELVASGLTVRQIAAKLDRSTGTVRHWLRAHALSTTRSRHLRATGDIPAGGRFTATCRHHGLTDFVVRRDGARRCLRCRSAAVLLRRRRVKALLVAEAGGVCVLCGYTGPPGAMHFHHVDPATKEFSIGLGGVSRALERARAEVAKCVLLCANCHAEVEAGAVPLAAKLRDAAVDL